MNTRTAPQVRIRSRVADLLAALILFPACLTAQVARPADEPSARQPSSTQTEQAVQSEKEPLVLSPFVVNAEQERGYQARSTLLGSRLNTPLRDIASPIYVMTKDFLSDVGAVTLDEALRYSMNVENTGEFISATTNGGDFNIGVINNYQANRSRGLSAAGRSHDLFTTSLFPDSYNFERITIASGPNSILFGLANSAGTIDVTFKRANLDRSINEVQLRADDNDSLRASLDINYPIIKDKLAFRLAAVKGNTQTFRKPDYDKNERIFGTLTYSPFKTTTVRAWLEHAAVDRQPARNTVIIDHITPWLNAGSPLFNNGVGATFPTATDPVFTRFTALNPVLIFGQTAGAVSARTWVNTVVTNGPDKVLPSPDNINLSLKDSTIFPFDVNIQGNGTLNSTRARIVGFSVEQQVGENLFFEAAYNEERIRNPFMDSVNGLQATLQVDVNRFLPDQVTPNPNLGRYYVQGNARGGIWISGVREARLTGTYQLDLTKRNKWFGSHRLAGLVSRAQDYNGTQDMSARIINNDATYGDPNVNLNIANTRQVRYRAYLSNPRDPATGNVFYVNLPFNAYETVTVDGVQIASVNNPYGATGTATLTNTSVDSKLATIQSYWWNNRIVTLFGWREDKVRQATRDTPRIGTGSANSPFARIDRLGDFRSDYSFWDTGRTDFRSVVVHPLKWLSGFYSHSGTYAPSRSSHNPDNTLVEGSKGTSVEYGVTFNLLDERLSLKISKYETKVGPDVSSYRALVRDPVDQIEDTVFALGGNTNTGGYDPSRPQAYWEVVSDRVSTGYEAELIANPTKNWRILLTAAKSDAVESNIGKAWVDYVHSRLDAWAPFANSPLAANATKTVSQRLGEMIVGINTMQQADGSATEQSRKYRINLTNRYSFTEGWLKGFHVGGVFEWRSKAALGYQIQSLPNAFPFPGLGATVNVPDLSKPLYDGPVTSLDAFTGYTHKLFHDRVKWSVQLNIRNVLDSDKRIIQQLLSTGAVAKFTIQEPRSFILTNTFSF